MKKRGSHNSLSAAFKLYKITNTILCKMDINNRTEGELRHYMNKAKVLLFQEEGFECERFFSPLVNNVPFNDDQSS